MKRKKQRKTDQKLSRRGFFKGVGIFAAVTGAGALAACEPAPEDQAPRLVPAQPLPRSEQYPEVPLPPDTPPEFGELRFFRLHEARTVEAFTARLLPGTPEDPGAREAGVVNYIDYMLARGDGFNEVTYRQPPFAQTYTGSTPPESDDGFQVIWVESEEIERYGYQSTLNPREVYRMGLASLDRYTQAEFDSDFISLDEDQQDQVVQALLDGEADDYFEEFNGESFFHVLRRGTAEGMFSDPAYGGNRDMTGWRLIGYPGAQRAYLPSEILDENWVPWEPQPLAELNHFHPGQNAGPHVMLPVSGSNENRRRGADFWPFGDESDEHQ